MTGKAGRTEIFAGVIEQGDRHVNAILEIMFDGLDDGDLNLEREVHDIAARVRPQANMRADGEMKTGRLAAQIPSFIEDCGARIVPCSRLNAAGASDWVRRRSARARASVAAISCFSVSVIARIRKVRISSISVPSNRSPGLSGAMAG